MIRLRGYRHHGEGGQLPALVPLLADTSIRVDQVTRASMGEEIVEWGVVVNADIGDVVLVDRQPSVERAARLLDRLALELAYVGDDHDGLLHLDHDGPKWLTTVDAHGAVSELDPIDD